MCVFSIKNLLPASPLTLSAMRKTRATPDNKYQVRTVKRLISTCNHSGYSVLFLWIESFGIYEIRQIEVGDPDYTALKRKK